MSGPAQREASDELAAAAEQHEEEDQRAGSQREEGTTATTSELSQAEAYDELAAAVAEQQEQQQQQQPPQPRVEVCVRVVTRAVAKRSPGGTRRASATTTTKITVMDSEEEGDDQEEEEEEPEAVEEAAPPPRPVNWVIADGRSGRLETEPAKSNLARAHTLQAVAGRLRGRAAAEAHQLLRLQEEVESASGSSAMDAMRLWYLEHSFHRRLRHHLELIFGEMHQLREVHDHFDPQAIERGAGGPALRLLDDLSSSFSSASGAIHALPAASNTSSRLGPDARRRGYSGDQPSAEGDSQRVSETEEVCAFSSSGESGWAVAEEAAVAMATDEEALRPSFSPVQWSRDRFEKARPKGNSGSSSSTASGNDGLLESASSLQEDGEDSSDAAVDRLLHSAVEESEAMAAMEVFRELQRQFDQLADTLRQHALVAEGVLRQAGTRGQPQGAEGTRERQPPPQQLLLHEVALMHSEMQRTQASVSRSEVALQRVVDALPPAPTMERLPPAPPPARPPRRGLSWFSSILKTRFSRCK